MTLELKDALVSGIPISAGQVDHCDAYGACLRPNHRIKVPDVDQRRGDRRGDDPMCELRSGIAQIRDGQGVLARQGRIAAAVSASGTRSYFSGTEVVDRVER